MPVTRQCLKAALFVLAALAATGCTSVSVDFAATGPAWPPHAGPVAVLDAPPAGAYDEVGLVTVSITSFGSISRTEIISELQAAAAERGANAIAIVFEGTSSASETGVGIGGHTGTHGTGAGIGINLTRRNHRTLTAKALRLPGPEEP